MLTFFTTAKPFKGHDGIIQRNALKSWKLLNPEVEVILFGEDEGAAEVCAELGLVHHPHVERHESGGNRLDYMFQRASQIARHEYLCFSNCDIVLMQDFWTGFQRARAWRDRFLMVAQRWDTDITEPIHFEDAGWAERVRTLALTKGFQQSEYWIDFFLFRRGLYVDMPPLIVGHCYWDLWMIWKTLKEGVPVIDGTPFIVPVHQNHGYSAASGRAKGLATDLLSLANLKLIGGPRNVRDIRYSTHILGRSGRIHWSARSLAQEVNRLVPEVKELALYRLWLPLWHFVLGITRPLRSAVGLRSRANRLSQKG
jgi:hypothetical protein